MTKLSRNKDAVLKPQHVPMNTRCGCTKYLSTSQVRILWSERRECWQGLAKLASHDGLTVFVFSTLVNKLWGAHHRKTAVHEEHLQRNRYQTLTASEMWLLRGYCSTPQCERSHGETAHTAKNQANESQQRDHRIRQRELFQLYTFYAQHEEGIPLVWPVARIGERDHIYLAH